MNSAQLRNVIVSLVIVVVLILGLMVALSRVISFELTALRADVEHVEIERIFDEVRKGHVTSASVRGDRLHVTLANGHKLFSDARQASMRAYLYDRGVSFTYEPRPLVSWEGMLATPTLLFAAYIVFRWVAGAVRAASPSQVRYPSFSMSDGDSNSYTFADVGGLAEAKAAMTEVVTFIRDPQRFQKLGAQLMARALLLIGPPGTGKTLLCNAAINEARVPCFRVSGEQLIYAAPGMGSLAIDRLVKQLGVTAPCIVHVERIELIRISNSPDAASAAASRETLAYLASALSEQTLGIVWIFELGSIEDIDPILLPAVETAKQIHTDVPNHRERIHILDIHMRKVPVGVDVRTDVLAQMTAGLSGAELAQIVNNGALIAARDNARLVAKKHLQQAVIEWRLGTGAHLFSTDDETVRLRAAAYTADQTLIARRLRLLSDESFIQLGKPASTFLKAPSSTTTESEMRGLLAALLAGRALRTSSNVVELTMQGEEDLRQATALAARAVRQMGFAPGLGPRAFALSDTTHLEAPSPELARKIDRAISDLLDAALSEAERLLREDMQGRELLAARISVHGFVYGYMITPLLIEGVFDLDRPISESEQLLD